MLVAAGENFFPLLRVLQAQFIYPPLRVAIARLLAGGSGIGQQRLAAAQKIAQDGVDQPLGGSFAQRLHGDPHRMIHHGMGRRVGIGQLV